jgi:hypothetical protein
MVFPPPPHQSLRCRTCFPPGALCPSPPPPSENTCSHWPCLCLMLVLQASRCQTSCVLTSHRPAPRCATPLSAPSVSSSASGRSAPRPAAAGKGVCVRRGGRRCLCLASARAQERGCTCMCGPDLSPTFRVHLVIVAWRERSRGGRDTHPPPLSFLLGLKPSHSANWLPARPRPPPPPSPLPAPVVPQFQLPSTAPAVVVCRPTTPAPTSAHPSSRVGTAPTCAWMASAAWPPATSTARAPWRRWRSRATRTRAHLPVTRSCRPSRPAPRRAWPCFPPRSCPPRPPPFGVLWERRRRPFKNVSAARRRVRMWCGCFRWCCFVLLVVVAVAAAAVVRLFAST